MTTPLQIAVERKGQNLRHPFLIEQKPDREHHTIDNTHEQSLFGDRLSRVYYVLLGLLLIISFSIRAYDLNYNSAFIDESSSIVIGRLGVFQGDWWSYNASSWMSGHPFINPLISGITYMIGGVVASRLFNVILGVLTIETIVILTILLTDERIGTKSYFAGGIAGVLVAFSSVSIFVSRMATYDMKCFYALFLSLLLMIWAEKTNKNIGKWYFLSGLFLIFALYSKVITLIYIPFYIAYSFFRAWKDARRFHYWKYYFLSPLALVLGYYAIDQMGYLWTFSELQATKEKWAYLDIFKRIYSDMPYEVWWLIPGTLGMLLKKDWQKLLLLGFAGVWVLASHVVTQRAIWTMDKHVFITVAFFAVIAGIGISNMVFVFQNRIAKILAAGPVIMLLAVYSFYSYQYSKKYDYLWPNTYETQHILSSLIKPGDKVLAESGTAIMLAVYDINKPTNTTTFDWFEYQGFSGEKAFAVAVNDGYFDYIQLLKENISKDSLPERMFYVVKENMSDNYDMLYTTDTSYIYKRAY